MSVRFIVGRAGTGKTYHCLSAIRGELDRNPAVGPKLILLVPEQASLQMERALLAEPGPGASHRAEVLSFRRLAYRILQTAAPSTRRAVSENGRTMLMRHLLARLAPQLTYYRRAERFDGFAQRLAETVKELIDESVAPQSLLQAAEYENANSLQRMKLQDLALIYRGYLENLGPDRVDPGRQLELAREQMGKCSWLDGAYVWVDGFAGFTRQELLTVVTLGGLATKIELTVLCDPNAFDIAEKPFREAELSLDLFSKTEKTFVDLARSFTDSGAQVEAPHYLVTQPPPRFSKGGPIAELERRLFQENARRGSEPIKPSRKTADFIPQAKRALESPHHGTAGIELFQLPDRRIEVDYAVSRICQCVQRNENPLRYRDIAVIVRDLEPYHDLLAAALSDRNIPYFIDRRRPVSHHPLVELLRGLAAMADDDLSLESVRGLLKTGLLGIADDDADHLENYLLAHGIAGSAVWSVIWTFTRRGANMNAEEAALDPDLHRVNRSRMTFLNHTEPFRGPAGDPAHPTGRKWSSIFVDALESLRIAEQLDQWAEACEEDGDLDQAEEHRQIQRDVMDFLEDLADSLEEQPVDAESLRQVLEAGLSRLTLGLAPPMLDQVLVGSIERSRHPEVRAVVLLGFSEGQFPKAPDEDSILGNDERRMLERSGAPVGRPRRQQVLDDRLLLYTAVTRASEELVITWPVMNEKGEKLRPSPYLADIQDALPDLKVTHVEDPSARRHTWPVVTAADLAMGLTLEWGSRLPVEQDSTDRRAVWNALYERTRSETDLQKVLSRSFASLVYDNSAILAEASIPNVVRQPFRAGVSRLETFAACPFKHFAQYGLKLRERETAGLDATDVGAMHHAVLDTFFQDLNAGDKRLTDLTDDDIMTGLSAACAKLKLYPLPEDALATWREAYLRRISANELSGVVRDQKRAAKSGRFHPRWTELKFGFGDEGRLPGLTLTTPKGRTVVLRGIIDRVDLDELANETLGVVVDYKRYSSSPARLSLPAILHGLSLQLTAYLLVLAQHGTSLAGRPIQPAAAFYVPLRRRYHRVDHPRDLADPEDPRKSPHRPRGLLDINRLKELNIAAEASQTPSWFNATFNKEGGISHLDRSDAASTKDFQSVLALARRKLGELADAILDGDIAVAPYRLGTFTPCVWCPFGGVCRFEASAGGMRDLEWMSRKEVFLKIGISDP